MLQDGTGVEAGGGSVLSAPPARGTHRLCPRLPLCLLLPERLAAVALSPEQAWRAGLQCQTLGLWRITRLRSY